jgi:hypothetical protein
MSDLINSNAFNIIDPNQKLIFYKDLAYIDNSHDFCSERSNICRGALSKQFSDIRTPGITSNILLIPHFKCEDENVIFKKMLDSPTYDPGISTHIKNLMYEQTMNYLDLPNGPYDKIAWDKGRKPPQPIDVHIVFSKICIDGISAFSKETRLLIRDIFADSIPNFGILPPGKTSYREETKTILSDAKVYSIDASCIDFRNLLSAFGLKTLENTVQFCHLNDGASKFDSATKLPPETQNQAELVIDRKKVTLISANISPIIIKKNSPGEIVWTNLFNRFSYCLVNLLDDTATTSSDTKATTSAKATATKVEYYQFSWETTSENRLKYRTYMLVDQNCFLYSVSIKNNEDIFEIKSDSGYTLIANNTNKMGILIKSDCSETKENKVLPIGSVSVASLSDIYSYPENNEENARAAYSEFEKMITHLMSTKDKIPIQTYIKKILLDFKRGGDQLAVMSLKQLADLSGINVAFVTIDRLAYMYSKMLGVCTSIRVGVSGAYFEEPDGDNIAHNNPINEISEYGHNYNLWFHRTKKNNPLTQEAIFRRTIELGKALSGETAQYIIERFGENRHAALDELTSNLKIFYDSSITYLNYTPSARDDEFPPGIVIGDTVMMYSILQNIIMLFTLIINLNIFYISLLLSKIDDLSEYFRKEPKMDEQVDFKQKLEKLEELYKKLKKTYKDLPNNLVYKLNELINKYLTEIASTPSKKNEFIYDYFKRLLDGMSNILNGDNMEANYGILLYKIVDDSDKTLPSIKDYTINVKRKIRNRIRKPYTDTCKSIVNTIKIITISIYTTTFKNINNIFSEASDASDASEVKRLDDILKIQAEFGKVNDQLNNNDFASLLNDIILKINNNIKSRLVSNETTITINNSLGKPFICISSYNNNYIEPGTHSPPTIRNSKPQMVIPNENISIPEEHVSIDILSVIKLKKDVTKIDEIISAMNYFIFNFTSDQSVRMERIYDIIGPFVNSLGERILALEIINDEWEINVIDIENHCRNIESASSNFVDKSVMCTISKINLIDAFNDIEFINKRNEFDLSSIHPETKHKIISFGIINQLLKITGNKEYPSSLNGGRPFSNSDYILNSEYVLSLSLAKNFFKEFYWKNRLIIGLQFLDSTMRFYHNTDFKETIDLIDITRKNCQYVFDMYDLVSYNPVNSVMTKTINPAIHRILCLYISQIYLPSFNTVKRIALSLFPSEIVKLHYNKRIISKGKKRSVRRFFIKSKYKSKFKSKFKSKKFTKPTRLLSEYFSPISLGIINSTNSIQDSIQMRLDITQEPTKIENLYINVTSEIWSCGELATVYIDEQFCKISEYIDTFQTAYDNKIKNQVVIPSNKPSYYALIKYNPVANNQSFIMNKSIDFENVYNLIHLFEQFNHNPLYDIESALPEDLRMFDLGDKKMLESIGNLIGGRITVKDALLKIAAFVNELQEIVINYYSEQLRKPMPIQPSYLNNSFQREIPVYGGGAGENKTTNHFVLINNQLKMYVVTATINPLFKTMRNTEIIHESIHTYLSPIELDNTIELKGCLLLLSNLFEGMIYNNKIPPYTIEIHEVYDFTYE